MATILDTLEAAAIARLQAKGLQAGSFAVSDLDDEDRLKLMKLPAVNAAVQTVEFQPDTSGNMTKRYRMRMTLVISVAVRNLGGEQKQREAAYALLMGVLYALMEHRLTAGTPAVDIGVKPLAPAGMRLAYFSTTIEVWQFIFRTDTTAKPVSDEEAEDFLTLGMKYYLQEPANQTEDAEDVVELEQS